MDFEVGDRVVSVSNEKDRGTIVEVGTLEYDGSPQYHIEREDGYLWIGFPETVRALHEHAS